MTVAFPGVNGGPSGWVCPKCGMVYAPWVVSCTQCVPQKINYSNRIGITPCADWQGNHEETR